MERRRAIRYPLQVPASFSWEGEQGIMVTGRGTHSKHQREGSIRGCCHLSTDRFFR